MVPSFTDLVFILLMAILVFSPVGLQLFNDADTGWHIRTGDLVLRTWSAPRVDTFSYTKAGQPWYAWEWLYDALMAAAHMKGGLAAVRVLTAVVIALTFALLYRRLAKRTGNALVAVVLTVMAAASAQVHMLARPHVVTWLFTVLFVGMLYGMREGERRQLLWLPALMVLWVNCHGGWVLGPALIGLFFVAETWETACAKGAARSKGMQNLRWLFAVGAACALATLVTPYGYKLHVYVLKYLRSSYIMNHNMEFQSPNFHILTSKFFEWLLLLTVGIIAAGRRKLRAADALLVLFGIYLSLYSVRNLPIGGILLTAAVAPVAASLVEENARRTDVPGWVRRRADGLRRMSERMTSVQEVLRGHAPALAVLAVACALAWNGGRLEGQQTIPAFFSQDRFPVLATQKIKELAIHKGVFTTDNWAGYLIYELSPSLKVYGDDRHDFYGEAFLREFVDTADAKPGWAKSLKKYGINWVLMPPDGPLPAALRQTTSWKMVYSDKTAVLFERAE